MKNYEKIRDILFKRINEEYIIECDYYASMYTTYAFLWPVNIKRRANGRHTDPYQLAVKLSDIIPMDMAIQIIINYVQEHIGINLESDFIKYNEHIIEYYKDKYKYSTYYREKLLNFKVPKDYVNENLLQD